MFLSPAQGAVVLLVDPAQQLERISRAADGVHLACGAVGHAPATLPQTAAP